MDLGMLNRKPTWPGDAFLNGRGYRVLRVWNKDVTGNLSGRIDGYPLPRSRTLTSALLRNGPLLSA